MIKGITFDFWNTLFSDQDEYIRRKMRVDKCCDVIKKYKNISEEDIENSFLETGKISAEYWKKNYKTFTSVQRLETILSILNITINVNESKELINFFEEVTLKVPPQPVNGVRKVIAGLCKDYKLGIISDTGYSPARILKKLLSNIGISECFSSLNFSNEVGVAKPHPDIFKKAAEELYLKPEEIVHVGDIYRTDVKGAIENGFNTIHFIGISNKDEKISDAEFIIRNLNEIPGIIDKINNKQT